MQTFIYDGDKHIYKEVIIMNFNRDMDIRFCNNGFYDILKWSVTGLHCLDDLAVHEIVVLEAEDRKKKLVKYDILFNVNGITDVEVFDENKQEWSFAPALDHEWIQIGGWSIESWHATSTDMFQLLQAYPEILDFNIKIVPKEYYYDDLLDQVNEKYSQYIDNVLESYAQAIYEYEHDL